MKYHIISAGEVRLQILRVNVSMHVLVYMQCLVHSRVLKILQLIVMNSH